MMRKGFLVLLLLAGVAGISSAQDAAMVVGNVARTIGEADVNTVQYSGTGFAYAVAQNERPGVGPFPKFNLRYTRTIDYTKGLSREQIIRTQFENPPSGGGGQPLYTPARGNSVVGENSPWNGAALALTPHGWVKAAREASPAMRSETVNGQPATVVTFMKGKNKVEGYVNGQNLLERVDTWVPNPIFGDTVIQTNYSDYRDFGGAKFPMKIMQTYAGYPVLELTVSDVKPNVIANIDQPRRPQGGPEAEIHKVAEGVWFLSGSPDPNSMAVEFKDYVLLIESSVSEGRALANIAAIKRRLPNKPILYHLNSHHHGDHAAGLRTFVAEGATIITSEQNKDYYEQVVLKNPHTLLPDRLSQNPVPAKFIWVKDKYVLSDGTRSLEVYSVPNGHASNLIFSYLPKEKILFITDVFNVFEERRPNDAPDGLLSPFSAALRTRLRQLKLDIQIVAASHAEGVVSVDLLNQALQGTAQAPPPAMPPASD